MAERTEVAWAAGLFDVVSVQMTDLPILERFRLAVDGIGSITGPRILPNRKPLWHWYACAADARAVAVALLPYVDERNHVRLSGLIANYDADKLGTCEHCGTNFARVHRDRRFCSPKCARRERTARRRSSDTPLAH